MPIEAARGSARRSAGWTGLSLMQLELTGEDRRWSCTRRFVVCGSWSPTLDVQFVFCVFGVSLGLPHMLVPGDPVSPGFQRKPITCSRCLHIVEQISASAMPSIVVSRSKMPCSIYEIFETKSTLAHPGGLSRVPLRRFRVGDGHLGLVSPMAEDGREDGSSSNATISSNAIDYHQGRSVSAAAGWVGQEGSNASSVARGAKKTRALVLILPALFLPRPRSTLVDGATSTVYSCQRCLRIACRHHHTPQR